MLPSGNALLTNVLKLTLPSLALKFHLAPHLHNLLCWAGIMIKRSAIYWSENDIYDNIPFSFIQWGHDMRRNLSNLFLTLMVSLSLLFSCAAQGRDKKEDKKPEKPPERVVEKEKKPPPTPPPPKKKPGEY